MGKNIKSYATTQVHFPREREGSLTAKGPNLSFTIWYGLTVHIIRFSNYKQNFQNCLPQSNSSELHKFRAIRPHSPRITQNSHILLTYSILCFRHLPRQRTFRNSSGSCKFRTVRPHSPRITQNSHILLNLFYIMFQAPAPAENPAEFQQITQIPRDSPTQPANHANSTHLALKFKYM